MVQKYHNIRLQYSLKSTITDNVSLFFLVSLDYRLDSNLKNSTGRRGCLVFLIIDFNLQRIVRIHLILTLLWKSIVKFHNTVVNRFYKTTLSRNKTSTQVDFTGITIYMYSTISLIRHLKGIRKKWRIMQTGENSIIEARILYHGNSYT